MLATQQRIAAAKAMPEEQKPTHVHRRLSKAGWTSCTTWASPGPAVSCQGSITVAPKSSRIGIGSEDQHKFEPVLEREYELSHPWPKGS